MELGALGMAPWGDVDHSTGPARTSIRLPTRWPSLMKKLGVPPDFDYVTQSSEQDLRYIHKRLGQDGPYFVANEKPHPEQALCSFRVQGKRPELWWPDSGQIEQAAVYERGGRCVRLPIHLDASGSVFVMFRSGQRHRAGPDHGR